MRFLPPEDFILFHIKCFCLFWKLHDFLIFLTFRGIILRKLYPFWHQTSHRERGKEGVSKYVQGYCLQKYVWRIFMFNNFNIDVVSVSRILWNIVLHQCHNCLTLSGVTVWQIFKGSISCSTAAVKLMQISGLHECELFVETVCILFAGCEPNDWHLWRYFNLDAYE